VRALNTRLQAFPSSVVGSMFGFRPAEYFETEDPAVRASPTVAF
jgi:LemA protein